jgi:hypothetical protein
MMKTLILAAFAVASLTAAMAPAAQAYTRGFPQSTQRSGAYDNTANSQRAPNISSSDAPG